MAKMTKAEIQDELANLYMAKQDLAELDATLNAQAEAIMDQARADVEALKQAVQAQRQAAAQAIAAADKRLNEGK
jgi:hypothetical protein